jgi:hypothetical protein
VVPEPSLSVQVLDPPHQATVRSAFMTELHAQDLPAPQERARHAIEDRLQILASQPVWDAMGELAQPVALDVIAGQPGPERQTSAQGHQGSGRPRALHEEVLELAQEKLVHHEFHGLLGGTRG